VTDPDSAATATRGASRRAAPGPQRPAFAPSREGPGGELVARFLLPSRTPARLGTLVSLIGLLDIAVSLLLPVRHRLGPITDAIPGTVYGAATAVGTVAGVLLVLLGGSLKRRRRRAWVATVVLLGVSVLLHVTGRPAHLGRGLGTARLALVGLVLRVVHRDEFRATGDPTTRWGAFRTFARLLGASLVVGVLLVAANHRSLRDGWPGPWNAVVLTVQGMLGADLGQYFRLAHDRAEDVVGSVLLGLGLMTAIVPVVRFLRAPAQPATLSAEDDRRVRALLDAHPDSLGWFATREDKQVVWSATGKSAIAFRVVNGVVLAGGDPLGDPEAWPGAITAFLDLAVAHGWTPAVLGCSERAGLIWVRETGFQALELVDEAIVDTRTFSLEGRPMRNVRQMVNRIRREGYTTELLRVRDTTPALRREALADAESWRVGGTERGFSMATSRVLDVDRDPDAVVAVARRDGVVEGLLQFVPWGSDGMSLDLMRRNPRADPGINELLIVDSLAAAPSLGIERVSLNFAMFRSTFERGERLGAGPVLRTWRRLLILANRWFQLESLYRFNDKFRPQWQPRYVVYPRVRDIARVGVAMGQAEAFIVFPRFFRFLGVRGS
jgi:lysyl-tRNA synthetase class 2